MGSSCVGPLTTTTMLLEIIVKLTMKLIAGLIIGIANIVKVVFETFVKYAVFFLKYGLFYYVVAMGLSAIDPLASFIFSVGYSVFFWIRLYQFGGEAVKQLLVISTLAVLAIVAVVMVGIFIFGWRGLWWASVLQ